MMKPVFRTTLILTLALLTAGAVLAEERQVDETWGGGAVYGDERLDFPGLPENVEVLRLENGLQVLLMRNPSQGMVSFTTQVKVGSAFEDFRTSGMSHMLEHLLFNGSARWDQERQYALADSIGAWNNAHTTDFFTNYIMIAPTEHADLAAELQSEMLFRSTLPTAKFDKERGIVVGEIVQARDRGGDFVDEAVRDALYEGSDLAMPTLGTLSTIENMSRDDVYDFYKSHYVPNNMTLTVAGGFDREEVLAVVREHYGSAAPGTLEARVHAPAPFLDRARVVTRRGGDAHVLALAWEAPAVGSPDFFPFLVLSQLLDAPADGIFTRAVDALPAEQRPGLSTWWEQSPGFARLIVQLELSEGADPDRYRALIDRALADALEWGPSADDVLGVVRTLETETLIEREQLRHLSIMSAQPIAVGGVDHFLNFLPGLETVTAEDVVRVLGAYLVDTPRLAVHVLPHVAPVEEDGGPAAPDVVIERSELANGVVLVTMENPASPLFAAHVAVRDRAVIDDDRPGALNLVHRLLTKGIGGCDEACTARKLRALGAQLKLVDDPRFPMDDYYTNGRFSWIRLEAAAANGVEALTAVTDLLQHASFTEDDAVRAQADQRDLLARGARSARRIADARLARALYGDHPLSRPPEGDVSSVEGVSYDDLRRVYRRAFAPGNLIVTVVSPEPHERLEALLEARIAAHGDGADGLPDAPRTERENRVTASVGGQMGAVRLGSLFEIDPDDAPALRLLTAVLSDRLQQDLRETRGLSYSVGASLGAHGRDAELRAWLNPPMPRLAEGEAALTEFLHGFDPASVTQAELDEIRSALRGRLMMRRLSSIAQAYYLAMAELDGNVGSYTGAFAAYDAVTTSDLVRVGAKYLAARPMVTVVVD